MAVSIKGFELQKPTVQLGDKIEEKSLQVVEKECEGYPRFFEFSRPEKEVVKRLIHATTNFKEVLTNTYFTPNAIDSIQSLLRSSAKIIVDTNMIKSGLSPFYTDKYDNEVVCYIAEDNIRELAKEAGTTRTYMAVKQALKDNYNQPVVLASGNAPTFLYSAIETLLNDDWDLKNVVIIAFPVGFVNVEESKSYTKDFLNHFNVDGIIMEGRYGASTMTVSCLHAIYKLMK